MSKFVSKEKLKAAVIDNVMGNKNLTIFQLIDQIAVDVKIVRCRNCQHYSLEDWHQDVPENYICAKRSFFGHASHVGPDDFCSHGEMRED